VDSSALKTTLDEKIDSVDVIKQEDIRAQLIEVVDVEV